jgi:hypothetical protein
MTVYVKSNDVSIREYRESLCKRVLEQFQAHLPSLRFLCFIDDVDSPSLKAKLGQANQGMHVNLGKYESLPECQRIPLPHYVESRLYDQTSRERIFDTLIYLHGSTCAVEVSMIITFAHELQHFLQYGNEPRLWVADALMTELARNKYISGFNNWQDFPSEHEAILVSKRVATRMCGEEAVRLYADSQITSATDNNEKYRWEFFQKLSLSTTFHFAAVVNALVQEYRVTLEADIALNRKNDPLCSSLDFGKSDWWKVE